MYLKHPTGNAVENVEQQDLLFIAGEVQNSTATLEDSGISL